MKPFPTLRRSGAVALLCSLSMAAVFAADDAKEKSTKVKSVKVKDLVLAVPETWSQKPAANQLRLAQFEIPSADGDKEKSELVISSFGGAGGGTQANIDRWI